jgi:hypothetical protein
VIFSEALASQLTKLQVRCEQKALPSTDSQENSCGTLRAALFAGETMLSIITADRRMDTGSILHRFKN